ncbi:MAG TPA: M48 family metallopeptidase [Candidatus Methylomirabilis sp.]|jgi:hypothetical protein|nr:M48 family metallopeptidase [Candidatus Methylomirabilis sp.]
MSTPRQRPASSSTSPSASTRWRRIVNALLLVAGLLVAAAGCGPSLKEVAVSEAAAQTEREKQQEMALSAFLEREDRLARVSVPLLTGAAELCGENIRPLYGFELHEKTLYGKLLGKDFEEVAARQLGVGDRVAVRTVHPDFPAAGDLRVGDQVLAINDRLLKGKTTAEAMKIVDEPGLPAEQPLRLQIEREGEVRDLTVPGVPGCTFSVHLVNADDVNAFADGKRVILTTGMVRFARTDGELALVVGHEIAHNALGHISKQRVNRVPGMLLDVLIAGTTGIYTGMFSELAGRAFSKGFEAEADYAGLYIAARAGHDIGDAADFWRRMAAEHPGSIKKNFLASHPSAPERFVAIESTVREIEEKRQRGEPLLPELKK